MFPTLLYCRWFVIFQYISALQFSVWNHSGSDVFFLFFIYLILVSKGGFPLCPEILKYSQWLCLSSEFFTVREAGFEPGTMHWGQERCQWATTSPTDVNMVPEFCVGKKFNIRTVHMVKSVLLRWMPSLTIRSKWKEHRKNKKNTSLAPKQSLPILSLNTFLVLLSL